MRTPTLALPVFVSLVAGSVLVSGACARTMKPPPSPAPGPAEPAPVFRVVREVDGTGATNSTLSITYADGASWSNDWSWNNVDDNSVIFMSDAGVSVYDANKRTASLKVSSVAHDEGQGMEVGFGRFRPSPGRDRFSVVSVEGHTTRLHTAPIGDGPVTECEVNAFIGCGAGCYSTPMQWSPTGKLIAFVEFGYDGFEGSEPTRVVTIDPQTCEVGAASALSQYGCEVVDWTGAGIQVDCAGAVTTHELPDR